MDVCSTHSPALPCGRISDDPAPSLGSLLASYPGGRWSKTKRPLPSPCDGGCPRALSVSALRVRLGQDGRSGVRASGALREREQHRILHHLLCQRKTCNFSVDSMIES